MVRARELERGPRRPARGGRASVEGFDRAGAVEVSVCVRHPRRTTDRRDRPRSVGRPRSQYRRAEDVVMAEGCDLAEVRPAPAARARGMQLRNVPAAGTGHEHIAIGQQEHPRIQVHLPLGAAQETQPTPDHRSRRAGRYSSTRLVRIPPGGSSVSPPKIAVRPSARSVWVGYQRPFSIEGCCVQRLRPGIEGEHLVEACVIRVRIIWVGLRLDQIAAGDQQLAAGQEALSGAIDRRRDRRRRRVVVVVDYGVAEPLS